MPFLDDDVNQFGFQALEDNFNMSKLLLLPPEEVPVNQSSMLCNDQAGQNMLVDDNVINDSFHQTTQLPTSFPQTMMEGAPPSFMDDDVNHLDFQALEDNFNMFELLLLPPEEVPVNQSSMLCNDQAGQNMLVDNNDSIQQTTQFPTSFPQTMTAMRGLDGASSSCINQNGPNWPQTPSSDQQWTNQLPMSNQVSGMLPQPPTNQCSRQLPYQFNQVPITFNPYDPQSSTILPESSQTLRFPQFPPHNLQVSGDYNVLLSYCYGSMLFEPTSSSSGQQWTNQLRMSNQVFGMLPQPPMNQCYRQFPYQFNQVPIMPNSYYPQSSTMLPEPSQTLRFPRFPPHNLQVSRDRDVFNSNCYGSMLFEPTSSSRHQNSFIHQPQSVHVYMTQNATTSQHGGFNQPTPRIQCIPNQGKVDQTSVIPHIDNMQQENLVPRNIGKSTRSQMENLQVHVLQNQTARPNASNPGPDISLQSQNKGLNTQQVKTVGSNDPFWNYVECMANGSKKCSFCPHTYAIKTSISRIKWHLSGEERRGVAICHGVTKEVQEEALKAMRGSNKRHKSTTSSINVNDHGISTC